MAPEIAPVEIRFAQTSSSQQFPAAGHVQIRSYPPTQFLEMSDYSLTHLKQLEAESIHIIREVVSEFQKPVMLYSIGKDSAVLVHLARKAFYPAKPPFPLMHVDTTWKFQEMIEFRETYARKELGLDLIVHTNEEGLKHDIKPWEDSERHTELMKTDALKAALDKYQFDAAFGGARRDEEKKPRQRTSLQLSRQVTSVGSKEPAARTLESVQRTSQQR